MAHRILTVALLVLLAVVVSGCGTLRVVTVAAPDVNCVFDTDCTITVTDTTDPIHVPFATPDGRLQSRTFPPGEPGTPGAGLYGYDYRVDLVAAGGLTAQICVNKLTVDFGPIRRLDYDHDGRLDDVYVVTRGGLGSVAPSSARQSGRTITFTFAPAVCPGNSPGRGDTSFFFGLASATAAHPITAGVAFTNGDSASVGARAPQ